MENVAMMTLSQLLEWYHTKREDCKCYFNGQN